MESDSTAGDICYWACTRGSKLTHLKVQRSRQNRYRALKVASSSAWKTGHVLRRSFRTSLHIKL